MTHKVLDETTESKSAGQRTPLLGLTLDMLRDLVANEGLPRFAAAQIADWLYKKQVTDIDSMTNLSKETRRRLNEKYIVGRQMPLARFVSSDGTCKYLFHGAGGHAVEAVMIPDRDRATLMRVVTGRMPDELQFLHDRPTRVPWKPDSHGNHQSGTFDSGDCRD